MTRFGKMAMDGSVIFEHCPPPDQTAPPEEPNEESAAALLDLYQSELRMVVQEANGDGDDDGVSSYGAEDDESSVGTEVSLVPPPPLGWREKAQRFLARYSWRRSSDSSRRRHHDSPRDTAQEEEEEIQQSPSPSPSSSNNNNNNNNNNKTRDAWIIEQGDKEIIESVDMSIWPSHWNDWFLGSTRKSGKPTSMAMAMSMSARRLRICIGLCVALLLLLGLALGLLLGLSNKHDKNNISTAEDATTTTTTSNGAMADAEVEDTTATSTASTGDNVFDNDSQEPPATTDTEDVGETTDDPFCNDLVQTNAACYQIGSAEPLLVTFNKCEAHVENWVGIYAEDALAEALPNPLEWLWTCNSQTISDCHNEGTTFGRLPFFASTLAEGRYQAHLVARDGLPPFSSTRASTPFEVRAFC